MAVNKVIYDDRVLIDLSGDTLNSANSLLSGVTAHTKSGTKITGTNGGYTAGFGEGYARATDIVMEDYAPLIIQGMCASKSMRLYTGGSFAYSPDDIENTERDFYEMTGGTSWRVADFFEYSMVSSSSVCTISTANWNTEFQLEVYIKVVCKYMDLSGDQAQDTFYKLYSLDVDEEVSNHITCDGSDQVWTATVEGIRWYYSI